MEDAKMLQRGQPSWIGTGELFCHFVSQVQRAIPARMLAVGGKCAERSGKKHMGSLI